MACGRFPDGDSRLGSASQIACAAQAHAWLRRWTALHWASKEGHTETLKALVVAGADVHCEENDGYGAGRCMAVELAC